MIGSMLLVLALAGQHPDVRDDRRDLEFGRAVEDLAIAVAGAAHPGPPAPFRSLFARMGSPCYHCREGASARVRRLIGADPASERWLWWGLRDRDPEVRVRCNAILRRRHPCPACQGDGWHATDWGGYPCSACDGFGTAWYHDDW